MFSFASYDSNSYAIDNSTANDYFTATMTSVSNIVSFAVGSLNSSNFAVTSYVFTITPNSPIL